MLPARTCRETVVVNARGSYSRVLEGAGPQRNLVHDDAGQSEQWRWLVLNSLHVKTRRERQQVACTPTHTLTHTHTHTHTHAYGCVHLYVRTAGSAHTACRHPCPCTGDAAAHNTPRHNAPVASDGLVSFPAAAALQGGDYGQSGPRQGGGRRTA